MNSPPTGPRHSRFELLVPLVAALKHARAIHLQDVVKRSRQLFRRCECLPIEADGGLMAPLGEGLALRYLIGKLGCKTTVIAANRLGAINHTILTTETL